GVTPVPAMIKQNGLPKAVNPNELFKIDTPDMEMFNKFSDNLKAKIASSPEWQKLQNKPSAPQPQSSTKSGFDDLDDDVPF
ncbi:MAG: hypothetical protein EBS66_19060, partial [Betaproteobacteria bacterium]|nr:hypothetical protein [Betaproteobacteria bacterium]